jgi:DNA recombination protein RmuC
MNEPLFKMAGLDITSTELAIGLLALALGFIFARLIAGRPPQPDGIGEIDQRLEELDGRLRTMAEILGTRQQDVARHLGERLDTLSDRVGATLTHGATATNQSLTRLHERIAVIDRAQRGIADLSGKMDDLTAIFTNKQARGAFGQGAMEAIVADCLPCDAYAFQATLTSGVRPDCLVAMPNALPLAIDAKFPLESALAIARSETEEAEARARGLFRRDCLRHVIDIRDKYLIPGETQDLALMFVPSESLFARLHEEFDDVVQRAHRARVIIVSPSLLVLAVQLVRSLNRDRRVEEAAHLIKLEVGNMIEDLCRLRERVGKLASHHDQARRDLELIVTSTDKLVRRGERISDMELDSDAPERARGLG